MSGFHPFKRNREFSVTTILSRRWRSLRITSKFGLAFGLLLMIIVIEAVISYAALTSIWEANNDIVASTDIQRLAMDAGQDWETIHRFRHDYFYQSRIIGAQQAYEQYALPAGVKIADVIRDGAELKRITSFPSSSDIVQGSDTTLQQYLSEISQYATIFQEATDFELQLSSSGTGLKAQLTQKVDALPALLRNGDQPADLLAAYYELRFFEQDYLTAQSNSSLSSFTNAIYELQQTIEKSTMEADQKESALMAMYDYEDIAGKIIEVDNQIRERLNLLELEEQSIEPKLLELRATINREVYRVQSQIGQTRQTTTVLMLAGMTIGLVFATFIARLLNRSVTHNITTLTAAASQLHSGNLEARVKIDSGDELGQLADTFNDMAAQLDETIHRLELVREANLDWAREHDVDKIIEKALDTAMCLSSADAGFIGLAEGEEIILVKAIGPHAPEIINSPLPMENGMVARAVRHTQTEMMLDASANSDDFNLSPAPRAKIAIPLISAQQLIGVLSLESQQAEIFTPDTIKFLTICASGAAVAIHNALLYANAQRLAIEDPLTGLYNRRGMFELSMLEINRTARFHRPISALFIDVDNFKQFNDHYGYKVGDLVLRAVARCLQKNVRDIDLVSRYGGEEFVVLLPELGQVEAITVAERLRKIIGAECLETDQGIVAITISVGVGVLEPASEAVQLVAGYEMQLLKDLIECAGAMLQQAKAEGRDRVAAPKNGTETIWRQNV